MMPLRKIQSQIRIFPRQHGFSIRLYGTGFSLLPIRITAFLKQAGNNGNFLNSLNQLQFLFHNLLAYFFVSPCLLINSLTFALVSSSLDCSSFL